VNTFVCLEDKTAVLLHYMTAVNCSVA